MPKEYLAWQRLEGQSGHEAGRLLLSQLYAQYVGGEMPPVRLGEKGKPYWEDSPWHFSISHTKHHAFCVLSRRPVGIDAEELSRPVKLRFAEKLLSPGEYAQFLVAEDQQRAFLSFWVLKEATAKCSGEGVRIHPRHTDFSLPDERIQQIDGCLVAIITEV